jgi:hypothetical protein
MTKKSGRNAGVERRERQRAAVKAFFGQGGSHGWEEAVARGVARGTVQSLVKGHDSAESALKALEGRRQPGAPTVLKPDVERALTKVVVEASLRNNTLNPLQVKAMMFSEAKAVGKRFGVRFCASALSGSPI